MLPLLLFYQLFRYQKCQRVRESIQWQLYCFGRILADSISSLDLKRRLDFQNKFIYHPARQSRDFDMYVYLINVLVEERFQAGEARPNLLCQSVFFYVGSILVCNLE